MNLDLNKYVTRYYARWVDYARYLCRVYGIESEAYDIFSESLLDLFFKSPETIGDLLSNEEVGDKKLLNYTKKIIRNNVLQFKFRGRQCSLFDSETLAGIVADMADDAPSGMPEEVLNGAREIEADFRDDSFLSPLHQADLPVTRNDIKVCTSIFRHTPQVFTRPNGTKRVYMPITGKVYYKEGGRRKTKTKHFSTRGEAWMWAERFKAEVLAGIVVL